MGIFPKVRGEHIKCLKLPPRQYLKPPPRMRNRHVKISSFQRPFQLIRPTSGFSHNLLHTTKNRRHLRCKPPVIFSHKNTIWLTEEHQLLAANTSIIFFFCEFQLSQSFDCRFTIEIFFMNVPVRLRFLTSVFRSVSLKISSPRLSLNITLSWEKNNFIHSGNQISSVRFL